MSRGLAVLTAASRNQALPQAPEEAAMHQIAFNPLVREMMADRDCQALRLRLAPEPARAPLQRQARK